MARFSILMLIAVCLCNGPSLCRLDMNELEAAASAYEDFHISNNAVDEIEPDTISLEAQASGIKRDVKEEVFVKVQAPKTGGVEHLDITSSPVIQAAKDSLNRIKDGNKYTFIKLLEATREVQNTIILTYKVNAKKCNPSGPCQNVTCNLELKKIGKKEEFKYTCNT